MNPSHVNEYVSSGTSPTTARPRGASKNAIVPFASTAPIDPSQILTLKEVAGRLKVSERFIYEKTRRRSQNPLPCIRIGRYLRFDWVRVSAWLREQERAA